jgi:hypothetical protein
MFDMHSSVAVPDTKVDSIAIGGVLGAVGTVGAITQMNETLEGAELTNIDISARNIEALQMDT